VQTEDNSSRERSSIIALVSKEPLGRLVTEPDGVMRIPRIDLRLPPIVDVGCACSETARDLSMHKSAAEPGVRRCSSKVKAYAGEIPGPWVQRARIPSSSSQKARLELYGLHPSCVGRYYFLYSAKRVCSTSYGD